MSRIIFLTVFAPLLVFGQNGKAPESSAPAPVPAAPRRVNSPSASSAAARRNENVSVSRIDLEGQKEANIRLGATYSITPQGGVEANRYTTEHGRPSAELSVLRPAAIVQGWHGEFTASHQNSIFNARTFFQVGDVKPSHQNQYGGRFTANLTRIGFLTLSLNQRKIRGMVNGNVLVPLANERTPTASDPALRALITRFLGAYPAELPNRTDFDERMLNTNAPQRIDETDASARLDHSFGSKTRLFGSYVAGYQDVQSFQLVAGQNPDMDIRNHRARLTVARAVSASTDLSFGLGFTRNHSALLAEPNSVGPRVRMGFQIEELGPDSHFPIDRATNAFRFGGLGNHRASGGRHTLTFGGDAGRFQLNGIETNNSRGLYWFTSNFGFPAIQNLLAGRSTLYEVTVGEMARGFRNWNANLFVGDQWRVRPGLQLYFGLRYSLETAPYEVNGLNQIPYGCDCNNFAPRFSVAWQMPAQWLLRTGYGVSFDAIPPVTYQQVRYNPPRAIYMQISNPDVLNPLRGIDLTSPTIRSSPTFLSPDLVSPYAHQYNLSFERKIGGGNLRFGYVGSRSFKLMNVFIENRADIVPGIPLTTSTVDARRADSRYYDVKYLTNGGIAYLDAAVATVDLPRYKGMSGGVSYTFGKAIDEGQDFTATAANRDMSRGRSQSQYDAFADKKGLSNFDSTHAVVIFHTWDLPRVSHRGWTQWVADGWQWTSSALLKSGTPLTLFVGSDAPGFGNVDGGPSDRPNLIDPSILGKTISHPDVAPVILSRDKFGFLSPGQLRGSLGRNTFRKAGIANWNGALSKRWRLPGAAERFAQFRAEAINLGNHPQFDEPNRNLNASVFGKITNTLNDGRVFQFTLRFVM